MTTPNGLRRKISDLLYDLLDRGLILLPATIVVENETVTWRSATPLQKFVDFVEHPTVRTYRKWAEAGEYAALLPDGALLQIRYRVVGGTVVAHRLAYIPCPYSVDQDLLQTDPVADVLDLHAQESPDDVRMQSAIRFDFDPEAAGPGHPAAHLTINVSSCRIACEAPMSPEDFVQFIYKHFYHELWYANVTFFQGMPRSDAISTMNDDERYAPHVSWRRSS
ncbi:DUF2290 domain-containing protein [Arthrobacter zhaoguopingii]|uniref:DUF2290 domain-containing protein n=1 Tax=Arthrobacter zhaoguopingii TaxID=2681491 RepID=UPI00135ABF7F|nr:DUF2290 domain-containing protein [Arthrobacter zhaoguopingii]